MEITMKQKKKESPLVVYKATFSNAMVGFDGIAKESRNGVMPFKPEHFKFGELKIDPNKDYGNRRGFGKDIIKRMEDHPKNRTNGGALFYQVDQNALDEMEYMAGTIVARMPSGGITKEVSTQLGELYKAMIDGYDKDAHDILVEEVGLVFDAFCVRGILKPEKAHDQMRVRARLTEFFATLEERDIWEPPDKLKK